MKVFSKVKYIEMEGIRKYNTYCCWVDRCDGHAVVNGKCLGCFDVIDEWCEEVYNPVEESGRILNECFPQGFPSQQTVNCRCAVVSRNPAPPPRYKIVIECHDNTTTAQMFVDGCVVKEATAKRNPADKFNWRIGAQMAFNRLWEKKKKQAKNFKYSSWISEALEHAMKSMERKMISGGV